MSSQARKRTIEDCNNEGAEESLKVRGPTPSATKKSKETLKNTAAAPSSAEISELREEIVKTQSLVKQLAANFRTSLDDVDEKNSKRYLEVEKLIRNPKYSDWWKVRAHFHYETNTHTHRKQDLRHRTRWP